jgi:hypothetical protein
LRSVWDTLHYGIADMSNLKNDTIADRQRISNNLAGKIDLSGHNIFSEHAVIKIR